MVSLKIEGGAKLSTILANLSPGKQRGVLQKMLMKAAAPIEGRMAQLAPIEPGAPDLKDSITTSAATDIADIDGYGSRKREAGEAAVAIGPTVKGFYGLFQEFGTAPQGKHPGHAAQPFARPAFDEGWMAALASVQDDIRAYLREHSDRSLTGRNL